MQDLLTNETGFKSPYATPEKDLTSVETPDARTLIFHFSGPQSDADWMMSLPYTAPVPKDADTRQAYSDRPVASGPYKIADYQHDTALSLVRNENWDPATDPNRPAYPDRFQFELNVDTHVINDRLVKGAGNDAFAVPLGATQSMTSTQAESPAIKARFVNGPGPCVDYLTMNTQRIKDPDVRHAIALAIDRQGMQTTYGGDLCGTVVDSVIRRTFPVTSHPISGWRLPATPTRRRSCSRASRYRRCTWRSAVPRALPTPR